MLFETAALSVIDRLIQLVKAREDDKRKLFTDHIEPLFLDSAQIHANYLIEIGSLDKFTPREGENDLDALDRAGNTDLDALYQAVSEKKAALETIRVKVHALARVNRGDVSPEAFRFFAECQRYLCCVAGEERNRYFGPFSYLMQRVSEIRNDPESPSQLAAEVSSLLELLKRRWSDLTLAYAEARVSLL